MKYRYNGQLHNRSEKLRKEMTKEERRLWFEFLQDLPVRIKRQKIIGNYIADFYCATKKTAIEIDGSQHFEEIGIEYDIKRGEYLSSVGVKVLRYNNYEVNTNFDGVCADIMKNLDLG